MTDTSHSPVQAPSNHEWDVPAFLLADAADAAQVKVNVLKAWLDRGVAPLGPTDRAALGKGSGRVFTLRRLTSMAIMAELTRLGLPPSRAGIVAFSVTDVAISTGGVTMSLSEATQGGFLIVHPVDASQSDPEEAHFDFVPASSSRMTLEALMGERSSASIVALGSVFEQVMDRLAARGKWPLK